MKCLKKAKRLLLYIIMLMPVTLLGQNAMPVNKDLPNIMSPEAASLGKYGMYDVNLYTGSPNISIPFHQISENGVNIPIALSYDASGFIPNRNASVVGTNWNLVAGGAITRTVNGRADDSYDLVSDPFGNDKGYIYARIHAQKPNYSAEFIRTIGFLPSSSTLSSSFCCPSGAPTIHSICYNPTFNLDYEYQPDIFAFNFLGHSGKFFMDNNGQVQVSADRRYKVDLSGMAPIYDFQSILGFSPNVTVGSLENNTISVIKMTSDDGYEFTFGGKFKELEVQFSYTSPFDRGVSATSGVINAWYLTKVKTPEGVIINFKYKSYSADDATVIGNLFTNSESGPINNTPGGFLEVKIFASQRRTYEKVGGSITSNNNTVLTAKALVKHCYLEEIETELQKVKFFYTEKDQVNKFYDGTINGYAINPITGNLVFGNVNRNSNYFTQRLYKIDVSDVFNGGGIPQGYQPFANSKQLLLNYVYKPGSSTYRLFLDNVVNNGLTYNFAYTNNDNLPAPYTLGTDLWGYYNGQNNTDLVGDPGVPFGPIGEFETDLQSPGRDRRAYANVATDGMLKSISYPTGGKTEFTFENHEYGKILKRKVSSGIVPVWENATGIAGGLRIKEIKNTPGTTTTYKYLLNYEQGTNGGSSGLLVKNEIYKTDFFDAISSNVQRIITDNNISGASSYGAPHIGYKEVVEINSEGFSKYVFTNHETNPDTYDLGSDSYKITNDLSAPLSNFNNQLKRLFKYSSREDERGKLKRKTIYSSSNTPVLETEYTYNTDPQRDAARTLGVFVPHNLRVGAEAQPCTFLVGVVHSYALYYYHNLVSSEIVKNYGNGLSVPIITTTTYTYKSNTNPLLTQKTVTQSDGSVLKYQYEYPEDFIAQSPYSTMVSTKNILTPVVTEKVLKNNTLLSVNKRNYAEFNGLIYKVASQKMINQQELPNTELDILSITKYNSKGMITEANKPGNHKLSYLWNHKGLFNVAQVVNADNLSVAYTSFEADGNGGWNFSPAAVMTDYSAITGQKRYSLGPSATLSLVNTVPAGTYIVSYWSKNGQYNVSGSSSVIAGTLAGDWRYYQHTVTGVTSVSISGSGVIDEVRLYPQGAFMTTYTYEALVGITSQCSSNNRIIYYEYDLRGRLVMIRDQDRKILKKICYTFSGEAGDCQLESDPSLQLNGQTRCKPCPSNSNYVTNVFQKGYIDVNPQSPTFNQVYWMDDLTNTSCTASPADWQNTATALRCQLSAGQNTGYQEQEQKDMNPCSPTYNTTRWVQTVQNTTACPLPVTATIGYQNFTSVSGFVAVYTNISTSQSYTFNVPAGSGSGTLGTIPVGSYTLTISKPGNWAFWLFGTGCSNQSGNSATFSNVAVTISSCNTVIIDFDF